MVGLAKAADDKSAGCQAGEPGGALVGGFLRGGVEHHVLVHLVADQQDVGRVEDVLQRQHVGPAPHGGAGVVGAVDQDGAGARRDGGLDLGEVGAECAGCERHPHHGAACEFDVGHITVVTRLQNDHFVPRPHHGQDGGDDGLGGSGCNGYFACSAVLAAVLRFYFCSNGFTQRQHTRHGRVLVLAALHGLGHGLHQLRITVEIREALAQVDRVLFRRQC